MSEWICSVTEKNNHEWTMVAKQELVRCSECKWKQWVDTSDEVVFCKLYDRGFQLDFFCADGEKE